MRSFDGHQARALGYIVAVSYAVAVAYIATPPWRGLAPPAGQRAPAIGPGLVLLTPDFLSTELVEGGRLRRRDPQAS